MVIIYIRRDLLARFQDLPVHEVTLVHTRHPRTQFEDASAVLFVDDDDTVKVLKTRYPLLGFNPRPHAIQIARLDRLALPPLEQAFTRPTIEEFLSDGQQG